MAVNRQFPRDASPTRTRDVGIYDTASDTTFWARGEDTL